MPSPSPIAVRFLPSLTDIIAVSPIFLLCSRPQGIKALLGDGDTGWHIRTGEWILATHQVPFTDMFSFSKQGETWFAWEWLWDVCFALLHRGAGMAAVLFASMAIICLTFALVYDAARKKSGNAIVSVLITLLAVVASSIHWLARPHLFTLLFCILFYRALEKGNRRMLLVGLPTLMVLWTNLHGGFIVGLILLGTYALGEAGQAVFATDPVRRTLSGERARLFAYALALCSAATLANPYGYQLHQHVFAYLTDGYQMANIAEFQSISFHHPLSRAFELLLVLGLGTALYNIVLGRFTHFLLLMCWAHLALISTRNIPIFVIVATPLIAVAVQECLRQMSGANSLLRWPAMARRFTSLCVEVTKMEALPRWNAVSFGVLAVFGALLLAPAPPSRFVSKYDAHEFPEAALQAIADEGHSGRVFSTDTWGGYLIYSLYPQMQVFVDGRSDFYGPKFSDLYTDVMNVKPGWEDKLRQYKIQTVLVPPDSFLSGALKESRNWRCIFDDGIAIMFRPVDTVRANDKTVSTAVASGRKDHKATSDMHS